VQTLRIDLTKCLAQSRAFRALQPGNTVCLPWGRGLGKSFFIRRHWYTRIARWDGITRGKGGVDGTLRGVRCVLLMPTLKQAHRVHSDSMIAELAPDGEFGFLGGKINHSTWKVSFPGGSWIQWVSAENAHDNRGIRADVIDIDEADDISPEIFSGVVGPWTSEPWSLREMIIAGTPRRGRFGLLWKAHHVWPNGEGDALPVPGHYSFHATYKDAPLIVDHGVVEKERLRLGGSPEIFEREWLCSFDSGEGLVYPFFEPGLHVRKPDYGYPYQEIIVGVDHGFNDPGVIIVGGVIGHGADAVVHILEEVYERRQNPIWWAAKAAEVAGRYLAKKQRWYIDPSQPGMVDAFRKSIRDAHRERANVTLEGADNAIEPGVEAVASLLAPRTYTMDDHVTERRVARLYFDPSCVNSIHEFGLYRRKRDSKNRERVTDDIEDKNNHSMDSLRYLCVGRFGRPQAIRHEYLPPHAQR
jgi:hypothetical protein